MVARQQAEDKIKDIEKLPYEGSAADVVKKADETLKDLKVEQLGITRKQADQQELMNTKLRNLEMLEKTNDILQRQEEENERVQEKIDEIKEAKEEQAKIIKKRKEKQDMKKVEILGKQGKIQRKLDSI